MKWQNVLYITWNFQSIYKKNRFWFSREKWSNFINHAVSKKMNCCCFSGRYFKAVIALQCFILYTMIVLILNVSVYFITYRYTDLVMNSINDICFYEANMVYDLCVIFVFTYKQCRLNLFCLSLMIMRTIIVFLHYWVLECYETNAMHNHL